MTIADGGSLNVKNGTGSGRLLRRSGLRKIMLREVSRQLKVGVRLCELS